MAAKSYYLEQLKKTSPLYPLGKDDPKKKLGMMEMYARAAQFKGTKEKIDENKEAVGFAVKKRKNWRLK